MARGTRENRFHRVPSKTLKSREFWTAWLLDGCLIEGSSLIGRVSELGWHSQAAACCSTSHPLQASRTVRGTSCSPLT